MKLLSGRRRRRIRFDSRLSKLFRLPAAGIDSIPQRGRHWFPIFADQKRRDRPLESSDAPGGFAIARRDSVPDAPDVFPTLPSDSIEKRELQVVGLITIPTVRDVHHVPRFEPLILVHERSKRKFVLTPGHDIPRQSFVGGAVFGFKSEGMANFDRS